MIDILQHDDFYSDEVKWIGKNARAAHNGEGVAIIDI